MKLLKHTAADALKVCKTCSGLGGLMLPEDSSELATCPDCDGTGCAEEE
jgi:DnaJ-class molecular chaperone